MVCNEKRDVNYVKNSEDDGESNVWSTARGYGKIKDLMEMLGLNETIDQLAMADTASWYGHVLRKEDDHALRGALQLDVKGERKGGQKGNGRGRLRKKS